MRDRLLAFAPEVDPGFEAEQVPHLRLGMRRSLDEAADVIDHHVDDDLASATAPIRILVGTGDTISTPASITAALDRTGQDHAVLEVVDGEDHHLPLRRPDLVADAVAHVEAAAGGPS